MRVRRRQHQPHLPYAHPRQLHQLAMVMEVNLQAASLWDAIEDDSVSRREDKQALATPLRSMPPEMHPMLIGKGSAKARGRRSGCSTKATIACATRAR